LPLTSVDCARPDVTETNNAAAISVTRWKKKKEFVWLNIAGSANDHDPSLPEALKKPPNHNDNHCV